MDKTIYILAHKEFNYDTAPGCKTLQCGKSLSEQSFGDEADDTGDNISFKNKWYCETTGIYWIWKNCKSNIKGHMQYRRLLPVDYVQIDTILETYDIILPTPANFPTTVERQYASTVNINDLCDCEHIIQNNYSGYHDAYNDVVKSGYTMYYGNSFIAKANVYDGLCSFCFGVLGEFDKMHKLDTYESVYAHEKKFLERHHLDKSFMNELKRQHPEIEDYAAYFARVNGFLFERLLNIYVYKNQLKVYDCGEYVCKPL